MKATYKKHILNFRRPSGTSRGVLTSKETWFILLEANGKRGIGECGLLRGLSSDDRPDYEEKLQWVCDNIHLGEKALWELLKDFPSIQFGVEAAFKSLGADNPYELFPSPFTEGREDIPINGLVWMGEEGYMKEQIEEKIQQGFTCIKLKIGAIDFNKELSLLKFIRQHFTEKEIEIRVDANGAFSAIEALDKIYQLSEFKIHSIEQPISKNQHDSMAALCKNAAVPIALDEELIGISDKDARAALLEAVKPQYIILKPSLVGGMRGTLGWIQLAEDLGIGWWITSALESNIGLNAIAQFTFLLNNPLPQGLGTGALYTNNFACPLEVINGKLRYSPLLGWDVAL
ncbi:o-succinylbenzoate synthase [Flavobacterium cyanobacteriorum]|uniref:O-succinylbenzoate synthase n=1 Tax=Flavobacterium cyanobacteriorum TaxID=2022802 RepID=A0A255ZKK8_9FLAO|nr:o-succinylbenzoate synthase [Flavobacterium cyanobacteriorum]OYQ42028.1 o-succinylbenzoate synthase [Flavobacterium cyanobacteriorum]